MCEPFTIFLGVSWLCYDHLVILLAVVLNFLKARGQMEQIFFVSRVQMKSWAGKALEIVNCCAFLKGRLIGAC
jgi:hypothetical protein